MKLLEPVRVFSAFADETRLRILNLLSEEGELCVCDLMRVLREPQSKVSRHLAYLRGAGLARARRKGLWMYYRLSETGVAVFGAAFKALGGRPGFAEFERDLREMRRKRNCLVAC